MLNDLQITPGVFKENTESAKSIWFDSNRMRFRYGKPETIGGWEKFLSAGQELIGVPRSAHVWRALDRTRFIAIGTSEKYYLVVDEILHDITPIRNTSAAVPGTAFVYDSGAGTLTVTDAAHGAGVGDWVNISGSTEPTLNGAHKITAVTVNDWTIPWPGPAIAGGDSITLEYETTVGFPDVSYGVGWGTPPWGGTDGTNWGENVATGLEGVGTIHELRLWTQDNFGEDLVFGIRNGDIFEWIRSENVSVIGRGKPFGSNLDPGDQANLPTKAFHIEVSEQARHLVFFCTTPDGSATVDSLLIRWSSSEDMYDWIAAQNNSAGHQRISSGSEIRAVIKTRNEMLIWTDYDLWSMRYQGTPFIFGITLAVREVSAISPESIVNAGGRVFWMDASDIFYVYTGNGQALPCTLKDYVFSNLDHVQKAKVHAGHNPGYSEVWWFYPTIRESGLGENDHYVMYDYVQNTWAHGVLDRTVWLNDAAEDLPMAAMPMRDPDRGVLYLHEGYPFTDDDGSPLNAHIETGYVDIQDGENVMFMDAFLPDIEFIHPGHPNAGSPAESIDVKFSTSYSPHRNPIEKDMVVAEHESGRKSIRVRGRKVKMKFSADGRTGFRWRVGRLTVSVAPDGKRT